VPLPSIAGDIPLDQAGALGVTTPAAAPPLSFFDKIKLGYKQDQAQPDWGFNETNWKNGAIGEVEDALRKKGVQPVYDLMQPGDAIGRTIKPGETYQSAEDRLYRGLFDQVAKVRRQSGDPNFLSDYLPVVDKRSFDQLVTTRQRSQLESVGRDAPDGLGLGGFVGGLGHRSLDPINYLPVGGEAAEGASIGSSILKNGLRWGGFNMGVTAITEPLVREHSADLGVDRTGGDFINDLIGAGAGGFVLGASGAAIPPAFRFTREKLGEVLQRRQEAPPAEVKTGTPFDSFDAKVAKTFADLVPEDQRTPDEQAAIHAIARDAEVKATSPFVPGPAGDDAHAASLDRGLAALHNPDAQPQRGSVKPIAREQVTGPADVETTRAPARELLKAKIHAAEGDGPNRAGGNAFGPYQFEPRTWVNLFKRRYPNDPRSFDEIKNLRGDPHLNDVLINDLISENSAALKHAGFEENAGNLYLAHVLGHDRAVTVLRADPEAKLGDLLPDNYFAKNPFRKTDSAASLIHWAYGKMGDKNGLPVHLATPDTEQAAEAIHAGEADPQVEIGTGRFDVEALYGDVGMTDRPVLDPEHFGSPEEHAATQLRFERASDVADGFAPVMSRAEAFAPAEHFDALRKYAAQKGTVTPEAIGEALRIEPHEARRVVASMQAVDPNSPYMVSNGKRPIIRRPPKPIKANETMLEYLTRTGGGLKDTGGDLKAMGGEDFHKAAPFRRKLIDNEHGQTLDNAYQSAIDAGYFPEHMAVADTYEHAPDIADFMAAIDDELRGRPRHSIGEVVDAAEAARQARYAPEEEAAPRFEAVDGEAAATRAERLYEATGHNQEAISEAAQRKGLTLTDDQMLVDASDLIDAGMSPDAALDHAALAAMARDLQDFAAISGEIGYEPSDGTTAYIGEHPEIRDSGDGGEAQPGGGRSEAAGVGEEASRDALAQLAHDPKAGEFADPVGTSAEAQADSTIHDLEMQQAADQAAPDATSYRLDEEGGESDLAAILAEIDDAQKAVAEMRSCLKPKGGEQ
jgi:hypothetical protein